MEIHPTKATECLECGKHVDAHSGLNGHAPPRPGDLSVCFHCGTICIFNDDLNLRSMDHDELELLNKDEPDTYDLVMRASKLIKEKL